MNRFFNNKFARLIGIFIVVMMIIAMVEDVVEDTMGSLVTIIPFIHPTL